jgi:hypothetical protein
MEYDISSLQDITVGLGNFAKAKAFCAIIRFLQENRLPRSSVPSFPSAGRSFRINSCGCSGFSSKGESDDIAFDLAFWVEYEIKTVTG